MFQILSYRVLHFPRLLFLLVLTGFMVAMETRSNKEALSSCSETSASSHREKKKMYDLMRCCGCHSKTGVSATTILHFRSFFVKLTDLELFCVGLAVVAPDSKSNQSCLFLYKYFLIKF